MRARSDRNLALNGYLVAVCVVAAGLVSWLGAEAWDDGLRVAVLPVLVLSLVLVLGELRPIRISHGDGSVDEVTISSSFSLALVITGPLLVAVLAQAVATLVDDIRQRKNWRRILFNVSQYAVTLSASRAVYALVTRRAVFEDPMP